jgi:hypothetical protein
MGDLADWIYDNAVPKDCLINQSNMTEVYWNFVSQQADPSTETQITNTDKVPFVKAWK